jgi:hypothetical protein
MNRIDEEAAAMAVAADPQAVFEAIKETEVISPIMDDSSTIADELPRGGPKDISRLFGRPEHAPE